MPKPRVIVLSWDRSDPLVVAVDVAAARVGVSAPKWIDAQLRTLLGVPDTAAEVAEVSR